MTPNRSGDMGGSNTPTFATQIICASCTQLCNWRSAYAVYYRKIRYRVYYDNTCKTHMRSMQSVYMNFCSCALWFVKNSSLHFSTLWAPWLSPVLEPNNTACVDVSVHVMSTSLPTPHTHCWEPLSVWRYSTCKLTPSEVINSICALSLLPVSSCSGELLVSMDLARHCSEISITLNLSTQTPQRLANNWTW